MSEYINYLSLAYTYSHLVILQGQFLSAQFSFPIFLIDIEMGNAEYNIFLYECVRRLFAHKGLHGEATKASSGNLLFTSLSLDTFA